MIKRINILFILMPVITFGQVSPNAIMAFEQGNNAYREGNFQEALEAFETAAEQTEGFAIAFNLANTHFKLNQIPESILYYERALKFEPSNEDALYNLRLANDLVVDRIETLPRSKLNRWWRSFRFGIGPQAWTWLSISSAILSALLLLLFYRANQISWKRLGFFGGLLALLLAGLSFGLAESAYSFRTEANSAIVFTDKVDVKGEPRESGIQVFVLHAGTKVNLLAKEGEWQEIEIASGSRGWLLLSDLEII